MNLFKKLKLLLPLFVIFFVIFLISCGKKNSPTEPANKDDGMVLINAGQEFMMGSSDGDSDEKPVHRVYLDDFYMDKYEVTNTQYCLFLNEYGNQEEGGEKWLDIEDDDCRIKKQDGKYVPRSGYENHPVTEVTWYGANAYAAWAGKRLPTEAEWEYAARGGLESQKYPWGNSISSSMANYGGNIGDTTPVGNYPANDYGLYDMAGNVWEWCADWYGSDYYSNSPYENPPGPTSGDYRVLRGGSWSYYAYYLRCAFRNYFNNPHYSGYNYIGFRCVR